jgi:hypothetical protein
VPVVLIAPDKFKGSLSGLEVAAALCRGLTAARPDLEARLLPVETAYARRDDLAVVEMADVSGLARLPGGTPDALGATSRGTRQHDRLGATDQEVAGSNPAERTRWVLVGVGSFAPRVQARVLTRTLTAAS